MGIIGGVEHLANDNRFRAEVRNSVCRVRVRVKAELSMRFRIEMATRRVTQGGGLI